MVGMFNNKNIFTLQLKVIQTIRGVNKCASCRQTFKHSNTQHTDSGFFIHTESDMLQYKVQRLKMYKFVIPTVAFTCTILQYTPLKELRGKCGDQTEQQGTVLYNHWSTSYY